jgi:hypothetical protein
VLTGSQFPSGTQSTTSTSFVTVATNIYAGEWAVYNVTSGQVYEWSLCSADGGAASYDSQLTLRTTTNGALCYSDDICGDDAKIGWTATFTGQVRVKVSRYNCLTNTTNTTLRWRCASCGPPPPVGPCLTATYGQFPAATFTPGCTGTAQDITTCGYAGEYAVVNLTAGIAYTFSSSVSSDWITISNSAGTTGLVFGTSPQSYTPTSSGSYRFYTHTPTVLVALQVRAARNG